MILQYPLGLLGLLAIPILIIIYIIKNKYTEQTVSSTYLWTLSEKFLKRKNPLNRITGIISLILQILAIVFISLAITHPVIILPGAADEYLFLLDGSGSMSFVTEGETRFEKAKREISSVIDGAVEGSNFTLILMGEDNAAVYEKAESKDRALDMLEDLTVTFVSPDAVDALSRAQEIFNANRSVKTYLATDKNYNSTGNIRLLNVGDAAENYAVSDVAYSQSFADKTVTVTGNVISYAQTADVTVHVYKDDETQPSAVFSHKTEAGEFTPFTLEFACEDFSSLTVRVLEEDGLMQDNECVLFNVKYENSYKTLIVSDSPFFLATAIETLSGVKPTVVSIEKYDASVSGYELYIYDGYSPARLPSDGTVWLFGVQSSIPDSGFNVQGENEFEYAEKLDYTKASSTTVKKLLKGVVRSDVYISKYIKYGLYSNFTTLLSYRNIPAVFTGLNMNGNREVVFAFKLSDSNFPLLADFTILFKNLLNFSFPAVIDDVSYACGDTAAINVIAGCDSLKVTSPSGKVSYLGTDGSVAELKLAEVGVYNITMMVGASPREFYLFSYLSEEERIPAVTEEDFSISGVAENNGIDGKFDGLLIILILLSLIFLADWGVYCYEQYQLR